MARVRRKLSILWFAIQALAQYGVLLLAFRSLLPEVWAKQFAAPWPALLTTFLATHLFAGQLLIPQAPVLMGGSAAVTWSMCLYEILHAIEHRPFEWWRHATSRFRPRGRSYAGWTPGRGSVKRGRLTAGRSGPRPSVMRTA